MNLFDILAIGEATRLNKLVQRVNFEDIDAFIRKNEASLSMITLLDIHTAQSEDISYLYVVMGDYQVVTTDYEEALRFAIQKNIDQLNFYKYAN